MSPGEPGGRSVHRAGRDRAGRRRTMLWLVLILVMAAAVLVAAGRGLIDDDEPAPAPVAEPAPSQRLLVREGLRREDVAALLDQETEIPGERYLALTGPGARGRSLAGTPRPVSLEGFLFPATYEIGEATTARELVDEQVAAYRAAEAQVDYSYARSRNLTPYDVLIIASLVEREVAVPAERRTVAGVMYNRLKAGMRLDIDATVQYAIGEWKTELTASDLAVDSPYNTRRFPGLPPGPIASPGLDSIRAAARPERHAFLFYVAKNDGSGGHYFSRTAAEHDAQVARSRANGGG